MMFSEDNYIRFLMAATPTLYIGTKNYEGKDCYYLKIDNNEEIIEKNTGLIVYSENGENRKINYNIGNITDKDVQKLDITQYKLMENNL